MSEVEDYFFVDQQIFCSQVSHFGTMNQDQFYLIDFEDCNVLKIFQSETLEYRKRIVLFEFNLNIDQVLFCSWNTDDSDSYFAFLYQPVLSEKKSVSILANYQAESEEMRVGKAGQLTSEKSGLPVRIDFDLSTQHNPIVRIGFCSVSGNFFIAHQCTVVIYRRRLASGGVGTMDFVRSLVVDTGHLLTVKLTHNYLALIESEQRFSLLYLNLDKCSKCAKPNRRPKSTEIIFNQLFNTNTQTNVADRVYGPVGPEICSSYAGFDFEENKPIPCTTIYCQRISHTNGFRYGMFRPLDRSVNFARKPDMVGDSRPVYSMYGVDLYPIRRAAGQKLFGLTIFLLWNNNLECSVIDFTIDPFRVNPVSRLPTTTILTPTACIVDFNAIVRDDLLFLITSDNQLITFITGIHQFLRSKSIEFSPKSLEMRPILRRFFFNSISLNCSERFLFLISINDCLKHTIYLLKRPGVANLDTGGVQFQQYFQQCCSMLDTWL